MSGLSRRQFLQRSALLGGAFGLAPTAVADALAPLQAPVRGRGPRREADGGSGGPLDARTTLAATIAKADPTALYSGLRAAAGEPFLVRTDLGVGPGAGRARARRSLLYFGQMSDTHIIDTQSPARAEELVYLVGFLGGLVSNSCRPQEPLTTQVLEQMVRALNAVPTSPVTGAPCAFTAVTGDLTDTRNSLELRWLIDVLDGAPVVANSGLFDQYQSVQAYPECTYAWHPDDPSGDIFGQGYGYPAHPGLLGAAAYPFASPGLRTPWYAVSGNHDSVFIGVLYAEPDWLDPLALGGNKFTEVVPLASELILPMFEPSPSTPQALEAVWPRMQPGPGIRGVAPDVRRRQFSTQETISMLLASPDVPGPVGHGFTPANLEQGTSWWAHDAGPAIRLIGLDTNNHTSGADGSIPEVQWQWLEAQLRAVSSRYYDPTGQLVTQAVADKLVIVFSHHTSWTMDNLAQDPLGPPLVLHTGDELVALLLRFPNVVMWVNGHTHANTILPHPSPRDPGAGFWEINTPSCIDWPQQGRLLDLVDNGDGTLSVFTITTNQAADPSTGGSGYGTGRLASISRELAANLWYIPGEPLYGAPEDRNTELVVKAPFDLSRLSDAALEAAEMERAALPLRPRRVPAGV
ncbi:MAG: TIGR03767 family metallophosphoesterase [Acidimicrobiales bacterium]|nr:TIGR03767 family metallophosphoesterase [Acidimicrobiales bacterium]